MKNKLRFNITKEIRIRCLVKKKLHYAICREDGTILYNKKIYNSPSQAARAITNHESNGLRYWRYERTPGEWVKLGELVKGRDHQV
jgi:hypothetical protein